MKLPEKRLLTNYDLWVIMLAWAIALLIRYFIG